MKKLLLVLLLVGCSSQPTTEVPPQTVAEVRQAVNDTMREAALLAQSISETENLYKLFSDSKEFEHAEKTLSILNERRQEFIELCQKLIDLARSTEEPDLQEMAEYLETVIPVLEAEIAGR